MKIFGEGGGGGRTVGRLYDAIIGEYFSSRSLETTGKNGDLQDDPSRHLHDKSI